MVRLVLFQLRMLPDIVQDVVCTIAAAARHRCASFLSNELNQATLKSPDIENKMEILIGQNQGC